MWHTQVGWLLFATVAASAVASAQEQRVEPFDILIRGGTIVDGTGNPWFLGDLAIRGDRIAALGRIGPDAVARRQIDARGLVVAPGFIDMHSHSDMTLFEDGSAPAKVRQGVTTEILGEDTSGGPAKGKRAAGTARRGGSTKTWTTLGGYFDALESHGIAVNVASYAGLGTLLQCVAGHKLDRPDGSELEEMKQLLEEAMRDGALGLSTMLSSARELSVTTDDLVALCEVVHRHGGLYSTHIRSEGTGVFDAVKEAIDIGRRAKVPVDIIHLKIADQVFWGRMGEIVALFEQRDPKGSTFRPMSILIHAATTTWSASSRPGRIKGARSRSSPG